MNLKVPCHDLKTDITNLNFHFNNKTTPVILKRRLIIILRESFKNLFRKTDYLHMVKIESIHLQLKIEEELSTHK